MRERRERSVMNSRLTTGLNSGTLESMEIDDIWSDGLVWNKHSVPFFLRRVLMEKLTDKDPDNNRKIFEIVVHAVLLESGFVRFNPGLVSAKSVFYTLPEILQNGGEIVEGIVMVFHSLSPFVAAYRDGCRVWLDEKKFAPATIDFVWGNNRVNVNDMVTVGLLERQVMEIWKIVKDDIALPLLMDLCSATGLRSPPCLMGLPPELRAKILKSLPGDDVARVSCVCKELRDLANDNELWKQKCAEEEFGTSFLGRQGSVYRESWKSWFAENWKKKKQKIMRPPPPKIIVGYMQSWREYDRDWPPLPKC